MHAYGHPSVPLETTPDGRAYTHLGALPSPLSPTPMFFPVPPASHVARSADAPSASKPGPGLTIDPAAPPADGGGVLPDPSILSPYGPTHSAPPPTALYSPGFTPAMFAVSPAGSPNPGAPSSTGAFSVPAQPGFSQGFLSPAQGYGFYGSPALGNPYTMGVGMVPAQHQGTSGPGRTVYVGNLPGEASVDELLSLVKFGPIENVRVLPEKTCAFISFLDPTTAAAFHADACVKRLSLHGAELKIGWGRNTPVPHSVLTAVQQNNATRNVYLGNLEDSWTEQDLRDELSRFGLIDQVKIVVDRNIAFVHFLSISTAMKVVATLPNEPGWGERRVNYGKDRCAYVPKSQQQNQAHNHQAAAMGLAAAASLGYSVSMGALGNPFGLNSPMLNGGSSGSHSPNPGAGGSAAGDTSGQSAAMAAAAAAAALSQLGNRTVYLGNIHSETTTEEICNHVRGGLLQTIRYIPEKHIAFVTFIEPHAALAFFHMASYSSGVMIRNRRLKIGWGKHSGPVSPAIAMAVQAGGSRNVYVGNITDPTLHTEEKLRADFGDYGEIEQVNSLREKNCAFVNFCNIQNAIKAIGAMKNHPDYATVKISYGKDRCGNPPRSVLQHVQAQGGAQTSGQIPSLSFARPAATAEQPAGADRILPTDIAGEEGNPGLGVLVPPTEGEE